MSNNTLPKNTLPGKNSALPRWRSGSATWLRRASCVACLLVIGLFGCREHPRVTSRASLDLIKQVYTACNTQNVERLGKCKEEIAALMASGELSAPERESFQRIIALADAGDWQAAATESLQFARDQVR